MMEDLISRRTIIGGLEFVIKHGIETDGAHSISAEAMLEFVRELPIIQPEITHEQAVAYLQSTGWMQEHDRQMMFDGVRRLTVQPEPHWISVTERLPDNSRNVLITSKCGVSMAWYNGSYFEKGASTHHRKMKTVTAWRELPEPYKEVAKWAT